MWKCVPNEKANKSVLARKFPSSITIPCKRSGVHFHERIVHRSAYRYSRREKKKERKNREKCQKWTSTSLTFIFNIFKCGPYLQTKLDHLWVGKEEIKRNNIRKVSQRKNTINLDTESNLQQRQMIANGTRTFAKSSVDTKRPLNLDD